MPPRAGPLVGISCLSLACWGAGAQQPGRGTIELHVVAAETTQPIPFSDVSILSQRFSGFTDSAGTMVIRSLPAGTLELRVRRVGFRPTSVRVTIAANETRRVRVALPVIALRLASVKVSQDVCGDGGGDTSVVTILQQARLSGERYAMLAERYPFVLSMERVFAEQGKVPIRWSGRARPRRGDRVVQRHDTVEVTGRSEWRYAPGKLIGGTHDGYQEMGAREKMVVPHLMDLADEAFVATHCFRYAGIVDADSNRRVLRVDFRPTRDIRERDVRGSMYFDTATYQILKTTLFAQRPVPEAPQTDTWEVRVDSWFREIRPGIPIIDRIESTTTRESTRRGPPNPFAATEDHRVLRVEFQRDEPGSDGVRTSDAQESRRDQVGMSCTRPGSSPNAHIDSLVLDVEGMTAKLCHAGRGDSLTLLLPSEAEVAGVLLTPGRYLLRLEPNAGRWLVIIFTDAANPEEVGRGEPTIERLAVPATRLSVKRGRDGSDVAFIVEWDAVRALLPVWWRR